MAQVHLPALRATGAAEVHDVALAFNAVQDTALHLAGEQAALRVNQAEAMTNLGRRNQTLLGRQLDFISTLETRRPTRRSWSTCSSWITSPVANASQIA